MVSVQSHYMIILLPKAAMLVETLVIDYSDTVIY